MKSRYTGNHCNAVECKNKSNIQTVERPYVMLRRRKTYFFNIDIVQCCIYFVQNKKRSLSKTISTLLACNYGNISQTIPVNRKEKSQRRHCFFPTRQLLHIPIRCKTNNYLHFFINNIIYSYLNLFIGGIAVNLIPPKYGSSVESNIK